MPSQICLPVSLSLVWSWIAAHWHYVALPALLVLEAWLSSRPRVEAGKPGSTLALLAAPLVALLRRLLLATPAGPLVPPGEIKAPPSVPTPLPLTRDDPPPPAPPSVRVAVLLLAGGLALASGCATFRQAAVDCSSPSAAVSAQHQLHAGDELLDLIAAARADKLAPDSDGWQGVVGGLVGDLGRFGLCVLTRAIGDLLGHLDAPQTSNYTVEAACSACQSAHHAHQPREEQRAYLEAARRVLQR